MYRFHTIQFALLTTVLTASAALAQTLPPKAPVRPVTDDYFGTKVVDNYRWMENLKDPEMQHWMKAQADYTDSVLARIPGRAAFLTRLHALDASQHAVVGQVWRLPGDHYFYLKRQAGEVVEKLYERTDLDGAERLIVDPAMIPLTPKNQGKGPSSIEGVAISGNGRYVAVGITPGGDELRAELHVIDVNTGHETGEVMLNDPWGSADWLPGNTALVYSRLQDLPPGAPVTEMEQKIRLYLHHLGTDPRTDRTVFGYGVVPSIPVDPASLVWIDVNRGSKYAVGYIGSGVSPNQAIYVAPADSIGSAHTLWHPVASLADDVNSVTVHGDDLYLLTFNGASRYKILRTDARHPDFATAATVVPESDAIIQYMSSAKDALYVGVLDGGIARVLRVTWGPHPTVERLANPFPGSMVVSTDASVPGALVYPFSPVRIGFIGAYDPATKRISDTHLQPAGPNDDPSTITSAEVKVRSYDGTLVPLTIVYPKAMKLDGSHPALLTGYGAYGISNLVGYDPTQLAIYELGAVQATCAAAANTAKHGTWPARNSPSRTPGRILSPAPST